MCLILDQSPLYQIGSVSPQEERLPLHREKYSWCGHHYLPKTPQEASREIRKALLSKTAPLLQQNVTLDFGHHVLVGALAQN